MDALSVDGGEVSGEGYAQEGVVHELFTTTRLVKKMTKFNPFGNFEKYAAWKYEFKKTISSTKSELVLSCFLSG